MRRTSAILLTAAVALLAVGCGSDSDGDTGSTSTPAPASTPAPTSGAAAGDTVTVEMKSIQFEPKNVTVKTGQTVKWVNLDSVDHDAVADKGADFKSDVFGKDGTFEWTATKPGKVEYECTLHPGMVGTITVR